jgi:hypothetical protein
MERIRKAQASVRGEGKPHGLPEKTHPRGLKRYVFLNVSIFIIDRIIS